MAWQELIFVRHHHLGKREDAFFSYFHGGISIILQLTERKTPVNMLEAITKN